MNHILHETPGTRAMRRDPAYPDQPAPSVTTRRHLLLSIREEMAEALFNTEKLLTGGYANIALFEQLGSLEQQRYRTLAAVTMLRTSDALAGTADQRAINTVSDQLEVEHDGDWAEWPRELLEQMGRKTLDEATCQAERAFREAIR